MAHAIETRADNPANELRDNLAEAERLIVNVDPDNVEALLVLLDELDQQFDTLAGGDLDLRAETGRWETVQARIDGRPAALVSAAKKAGGWDELRARHAPATNFWWRLDKILAARRNRLLMRTLITIVAIAGSIVLAIWAINTFFPPDPDAVLLLETNTQINDHLALQDMDGALTVVDEARSQLPDDPELMAWEIVLAEQLGDQDRVQAATDRMRNALADDPALFWLTLSERRIAVGDLTGAEDAAYEAETLTPDNPRVYFLLANIAEFRGDTSAAIDLFNKTYELAEESAPQLAAISRIRVGNLMQSGAFSAIDSTDSPTQTAPSQ